MKKVLSWLGKLRPPGPRRDCAVIWWDIDKVEHCERKDVSLDEALVGARSMSDRLGAEMGSIKRIIIKDSSGEICWEWKDGKLVRDWVEVPYNAGL